MWGELPGEPVPKMLPTGEVGPSPRIRLAFQNLPATFRSMMPSTLGMADSLWRRLNSKNRLFLIAGPCVLEDEAMALEIGLHLRRICRRLGITYVFKASFDKANRSSGTSYRGPGLEEGLAALGRLRRRLEVPVLTDVHEVRQVEPAAQVVDILQIPAFLCRQTDLVTAAVASGRVVNLKKGQFMAPDEMTSVVAKASEAVGGQRAKLLLTERGTTFGYHNLVADMRSLPILRRLGFPVVFDATHSVQLPGAAGGRSGGQREFAPVLARCAVVAGAHGLFIETHPNPDKALSDGPNMIPLKDMGPLLTQLCRVRRALGSGV